MSAMQQVQTQGGDTLIGELLRVTDALREIVTRETELLGNGRWLEMHQLAPEKTGLAMRYDGLAKALSAVPPEALMADPQSAELRRAAARLDLAVRDNANQLGIHMDANRAVAELIAKAARDAAQPQVTYGRKGGAGYARYGQQPPPVAMVKVL